MCIPLTKCLWTSPAYLPTVWPDPQAAGPHASYWMSISTPALRPLPALAPTCTCAKWPWISAPNTSCPDENGVRIAELDENTYRRTLWTHRPLTDFWRVGRGYAKKLEENGLYTMGDIARCSVGHRRDYYNEDFLFRLFGVNAELLIDHAWGREPCTIADIKAYKPEHNSFGTGQMFYHAPILMKKPVWSCGKWPTNWRWT